MFLIFLYGADTWTIRQKEKKKTDTLEMCEYHGQQDKSTHQS